MTSKSTETTDSLNHQDGLAKIPHPNPVSLRWGAEAKEATQFHCTVGDFQPAWIVKDIKPNPFTL